MVCRSTFKPTLTPFPYFYTQKLSKLLFLESNLISSCIIFKDLYENVMKNFHVHVLTMHVLYAKQSLTSQSSFTVLQAFYRINASTPGGHVYVNL